MSKIIHLTTPLNPEICRSLAAGDEVLISGQVIAARDAAHKRLLAAIEEGGEEGRALPFEVRGAVIYYVGPTPSRPVTLPVTLPVGWPSEWPFDCSAKGPDNCFLPGDGAAAPATRANNAGEAERLLPTTSAGPTTAGRMDKYTPTLLALGLSGMIGKGDRSAAVVKAMQKHGAVYFAATGGAGALLARHIKSYTMLAWPELGPEALAVMQVEDFPAIVAIDSRGSNIYKSGPAAWASL